jgi:uncharacterized membrane protein YdjX (TVP38/TMEM64 family)
MSRNYLKRLLLVVALAISGLVFWVFELERFLNLSFLKGSLEDFRVLYAENRFTVLLVYFAIYVAITALSVPGAAVLTLAGGALFGFFTGTILVSFASTIGATMACAAARFLLRDWVQSKLSDKIVKFNEGIKNEGAFYLFTLRLIPLFPFWMINLVMGLTMMPLRRFYWVSQLGMLAGTMVYVNAGKELSRIDSLQGILSPSLLLSFTLLGIFPLAVKKMLGLYRQRRTSTFSNLD